jgi:hypothetical protein
VLDPPRHLQHPSVGTVGCARSSCAIAEDAAKTRTVSARIAETELSVLDIVSS